MAGAAQQLRQEPMFSLETGATGARKRANGRRWAANTLLEHAASSLLGERGRRATRHRSPPLRVPPPPAPPPFPSLRSAAAVKLFYWTRLAYREEDALTHPFVNARSALPLFALRHFETTWDEGTDTHAVLGWSGTQVVVAFRWVAKAPARSCAVLWQV